MVLLAEQEEITLTEQHWEVSVCAGFYLEFNTSPAIRMLVKAITQKYVVIKRGNSCYLKFACFRPPNRQQSWLAPPKPVKCISADQLPSGGLRRNTSATLQSQVAIIFVTFAPAPARLQPCCHRLPAHFHRHTPPLPHCHP